VNWFFKGMTLWLTVGFVGIGFVWLTTTAVGWWDRRRDTTEARRIHPTATSARLDEQDVEVLISLCETAMEEEPYTNRAVFLCRLIDKLEDWMLSQ